LKQYCKIQINGFQQTYFTKLKKKFVQFFAKQAKNTLNSIAYEKNYILN